MGGGGTSSGSEDTSSTMRRDAESSGKAWYSGNMVDQAKTLFGNAMASYGPTAPASLFLEKLIGFDTSIPGYPTAISAAGVDPFSGSYESATQDAYENRVNTALGLARTGTANVLAPLNRGKEFREAEVLDQMTRNRQDELRKERAVDWGIAQQAMEGLVGKQGLGASDQLRNYFESYGRTFASALPVLSNRKTQAAEEAEGEGQQVADSSSWGLGAGISCCFIFLEAYNGRLPWFVRFCRDFFITPRKRRGYVWLSRTLVPSMRTWRTIRWLVNVLMVKPLTKWGGWFTGERGYEKGWVWKPFVRFWFWVFDTIGRFV